MLSPVYRAKIDELENRFTRNVGAAHGDPAVFAQWLVDDVLPSQSSSSWRLIRSAFKKRYPDNAGAIEIVDIKCPNKKKDIKKSTSALRQKWVSQEEFDAIEVWFRSKDNLTYALPTLNWLHATILTGLRPSEWRDAQLLSDKANVRFALRTKNLKQADYSDVHDILGIESSGGSYRYTRTLLLDHLNSADRKILESHLMVVSKMDDQDEWVFFYESCRKTLSRAIKELWPENKKRISLYSARHQFSANVKLRLELGGYSKLEIKILTSALLGHASLTSQEFYAGKRKGESNGALIFPHKDEVIELLNDINR